MNKRTFSTAAATAFAVLLILGACAHHDTTATNDDYGQARPDLAATQNTPPATPNVIPGPAKVDESGNVYTSSAVGSTGNASSLGTNTNVNNLPASSTATVTTTPMISSSTTETSVDTTATATLNTETTPVTTSVTTETTVETPAVDTTTTTQETATTTEETGRRRMRKD